MAAIGVSSSSPQCLRFALLNSTTTKSTLLLAMLSWLPELTGAMNPVLFLLFRRRCKQKRAGLDALLHSFWPKRSFYRASVGCVSSELRNFHIHKHIYIYTDIIYIHIYIYIYIYIYIRIYYIISYYIILYYIILYYIILYYMQCTRQAT